MWALVAVLVVLLLLAAGLLVPQLLGGSGTTQVDVPRVIAQTIPEAERTLAHAGLTLGTRKQVYSTTVPRGHIVGQNPKPQQHVDKGSAVNVTVSAGEQTRVVPDVTPYLLQEATARLTALDFRVKPIKVRRSQLRFGHVIRTNPPPGVTVKIGSTIEVYYSGGFIKVPNVVGKTESVATNEVRAAGFNPVTSDEVSDQPAGTVTHTSPDPLTLAPYGSTVVIFVSLGPTTPPPTTPTTPTTPPTSTPPSTSPTTTAGGATSSTRSRSGRG
jgi:serine/threonine-protein kinase